MHMQNTQQEILASVKRLESQLQTQTPYQVYSASNSYEQSRNPATYVSSNAYVQPQNPTAYTPSTAYGHSPRNPTLYTPSPAYAHSANQPIYPPFQYQQPSSSFQSFSGFSYDGLQPSHSGVVQEGTAPMTTSYTQPIQYGNLEQGYSATSDPGISNVRNTTVLPCRVPLPANAGDILPSSEIPKSKLRSVQVC